jgi:hypothetical protein
LKILSIPPEADGQSATISCLKVVGNVGYATAALTVEDAEEGGEDAPRGLAIGGVRVREVAGGVQATVLEHQGIEAREESG